MNIKMIFLLFVMAIVVSCQSTKKANIRWSENETLPCQEGNLFTDYQFHDNYRGKWTLDGEDFIGSHMIRYELPNKDQVHIHLNIIDDTDVIIAQGDLTIYLTPDPNKDSNCMPILTATNTPNVGSVSIEMPTNTYIPTTPANIPIPPTATFTSVPTATSTLPNSTPTNMSKIIPAREPTFTSTPPNSAPTHTPTATPTHTPTITPTKTPTPWTASPTPAPTVTSIPPPTPTWTPTPVPSLSLISLTSADGLTTFAWQWTGQPLPTHQGFQILINKYDPPDWGAHDAMSDKNNVTQNGYSYSLTIDVNKASGVSGDGDYYWSVDIWDTDKNKALGYKPTALKLEITGYVSSGPPPNGGGNGNDNGDTATPTPTEMPDEKTPEGRK